MLSARAAGEPLGQLGLYPPAASMTPEFLAPPPRPFPRYPPRPRHRDEEEQYTSAAATYRFLHQPAPYPYLYRPPAPFSPLRCSSGFVPPAPRSPQQAPEPPPPVVCPPRIETELPVRAPHFRKGALIRLENGSLKRVEDMRTEDFATSAERRSDVCLTHCTLLRLEERGPTVSLTLAYDQNRSTVDLESTAERPFFVYSQGWASCSPERTLACYGLNVRKLRVGDVCVSLMARPPQSAPENLSVREDIREESRKRRWSTPEEALPRKR